MPKSARKDPIQSVFWLLLLAIVGGFLAFNYYAAHRPAGSSTSASLEHAMQHEERWPVKVGGDDDVASVNAAPQRETVAQLAALARPADLPSGRNSARFNRYGDVERSIFTVDADVLYVKLEDDLDYHVVIRDHGSAKGPTMVVEIPSPAVVPDSSPWKTQIETVRDQFTHVFNPDTRFNATPYVRHAVITGVGFFDFLHGQRGMLPNGLELHPVIGVKF